MPHGRYVAFEGDQPHNCDDEPPERVAPPPRPKRPSATEPPTEPFKPLYPTVAEPPASSPAAVQPTPSQATNRPSAAPPAPAPRPTPAPRPAPPQRVSNHVGTTTIPPSRPSPAPQHVTPARVSNPMTQASAATPPRPIAPNQKASWLSIFFSLIGGLLSSTFGFVIAIFMLLSLPFNVVAIMHLTGWSWFGALMGALAFSCVPIIGQIGYLVLAVMGAYYIWDANFDWEKVAYPATKTFSVSKLSDAELARFKTDVVRKGFEQACKTEALKTAGFDGKLPVRAASQCECFATNFAAKLTREDMIAFEKSGRYPDDLQQRVGTEVRRACQN